MEFSNLFKSFKNKVRGASSGFYSTLDATETWGESRKEKEHEDRLDLTTRPSTISDSGSQLHTKSNSPDASRKRTMFRPPATLKEGEKGYKCRVKELYQDESSCDCCINWSDRRPPSDDSHKAHQNRTDRDSFAILQRKSRHGSQQSWETHSIVVNSPYIKSRLTAIFDNYPGIDLDSTELTLTAPFTLLVHRWQRFIQLVDDESEPLIKKHLELLRQLVEPQLHDSFLALQRIKTTKVCSFENVPLTMVPGETVIHFENENLSAGVFRELQPLSDFADKEVAYNFIVNVVDWNGETFGVAQRTWKLEHFTGTRPVRSLDIFPLQGCSDEEKIRSRLIGRGKVFEEMRGQHFKYYSGTVGGSDTAWTISDRVLVDVDGYYKLGHLPYPKLQPLQELRDLKEVEVAHRHSISDDNHITPIGIQELSLTDDDQRLHTESTVKGFAFGNKTWASFEVTGLKDIRWDRDAFKNLVLDADSKRLLVALSRPPGQSRSKRSAKLDDFVSGKGRGKVILLHGPPGVGKTLTAESVAEHLQSPLYRLAASDLGTISKSVESSLRKALERCAHWKAVLLIDEADVFLEARSTDSLERNELVSIFLRHLEYYDGVLILTTNRIKSIDLAFESRIDITLSYTPLDEHRRRQIWVNFIQSLDQDNVDLRDKDLDKLAKIALNGRQIKSALKIANILAADEDEPLRMNHLSTVINLRMKSAQLMGSSGE